MVGQQLIAHPRAAAVHERPVRGPAPASAPAATVAPGPVAAAGCDALGCLLARAVAQRADRRVLARFLQPPSDWKKTWTRAPVLERWRENGNQPLGIAFVNRGSSKNKDWYRWDADAKEWVKSANPAQFARDAQLSSQLAVTTPVTTPVDKVPSEDVEDVVERPVTTPVETPVDKLRSEDVEDVVELEPEPERDPLVLQDLPIALLRRVLDQLPLDDVRNMQLFGTRFEHAAVSILRERMQKAIRKTALSSLGGTLCDNLADALAALRPGSLLVLSDQVSPETIESLTGNVWEDRSYYDRYKRMRIRAGGYKTGTRALVYTGEHGTWVTPSRGSGYYRPQIPVGEHHGQLAYKSQLHGPDRGDSSKMHVKSIIGSSATGRPLFLETGSANFTFSAMSRNTEAVILVEAPGIAQMFKEYADEVVKGHKATDAPEFATALTHFNARNPIGIRAALAPFVNVGEQLTFELQGADRVLVRMFLVSEAEKGVTNQPVKTLCALARRGVDVTVVVDREQSSLKYVYKALDQLKLAGAKVHTETGPGGAGIMHDKLVFAHYPATKPSREREHDVLPTPERWTVMIGSSGLTRNVIENENYENLLIFDDKALFDDLMRHDVAARRNRRAY